MSLQNDTVYGINSLYYSIIGAFYPFCKNPCISMENYVNHIPFPVILSVSEGPPGSCNTFRDSSTPAPPALRMTSVGAD